MIQPLCGYRWIGLPTDYQEFCETARLFRALKTALNALRQYYDVELDMGPNAPLRQPGFYCPYITEFEIENREKRTVIYTEALVAH